MSLSCPSDVRQPLLIRQQMPALTSADQVVLRVALAGETLVHHRGREQRVRQGEAILTLGGQPGLDEMLGNIGFRNIGLAVRELASSPGDLEPVLMQRIAGDNPPLQVLVGYLRSLEHVQTGGAGLSRAIAGHVQELAGLALDVLRVALDGASVRGARAARLRAIKEDVIAHLGRDDFSGAAIAARHGISPRYLRKLFEADGNSFSAFVLRQRLQQVYRRLADPRACGAISTLAFAAGFNDLSYFNRAFKRCYGVTPSQVRSTASSR